ncbi:MAG: hypothetical protein JRH15_20145, partial [Deltaproteobacteria bacterium]|nr:hypothetical protein [Deltaproteobacteria bacterium]
IFNTTDGGKNWSLQNTGTDSYLYSVSFTDKDNGWAVGEYGIILQTKDGGKTWSPQQSGTEKHLYKVKFIDASEGWAVGYWGVIIYTVDGGKTWQDRSIAEDLAFNSLAIVGDQCWVVGEFGAIYHTKNKGQNWEKLPTGVGEDVSIFGIVFTSLAEGWAVGLEGTVLRAQDGGMTWRPINSTNDISATLFDVVARDKAIFAVGGRGTIVEIIQNSNETTSLRKILPETPVYNVLSGMCSIGQRVWAVGSHGSLLEIEG